ncbi:MAG TPA: hypothetical protein VF510_18040 [Ktedonobacterales bacterium]
MLSIHPSRHLVLHGLLLTCVILLASCGRSAQGNATAAPRASKSPSAIVTSSPTHDPATVTRCDQFDDFAAARFTTLYYLDFPDDGVATATITSPSTSALEVVDYHACMSVDRAKAATLSPAQLVLDTLRAGPRGWKSLEVFPFDGGTPRVCAIQQMCLAQYPDPYAQSPEYYLLLEQARVYNARLATFRLRLAGPPPLVRCDPILFPIHTYPTAINPQYGAQIPLPPVTQVSTGQGTSEGITTYLCSAGSAQSVADFMQHNLPSYGWKPVTIQGVQLWKTTSGTPTLTIRIYPITDPLRWSILEYFPGMNV